MKVLHLIDHFGPGGEQRLVLDLAETRGPDVELEAWSLTDRVLPCLKRRLARAAVPFTSLGMHPRDARAALRLRSRLRAARADVLHLHLEWSGTLGAAAALGLGSERPAVVASVVNDPLQRYAAVHRVAGRLLASHVDAHVAISPGIAAALKEAYRGRPRRVELIPPGLDLARFASDGADAPQSAVLRAGARRVVGGVGRLAQQKAFHVLLEATPRLLAEDPSTRVLIVGDGPLRRDLESRAGALGVGAAVTFTGHLENPLPAFRAMDVFVLPSLDEGYGLVFLEAMACGVPVVGTRVIGSLDAVQDGITGLLVPPRDPEALAAAVLRVLGDSSLAEGLRQRAREWIQGQPREAATARTERLYRELLLGRGGDPGGHGTEMQLPETASSRLH
ncbi:MAG: glycosyltransferase family 4 protein [Gemmatimonadota bacterium]